MMTLRLMLCSLSGGVDTLRFVALGGLVCGQRGQALVAPLCQRSDPLGRRLMRPRRDHPVHIRALVHFRPGGSRRKLLVEAGVARAIIRDTAGRISVKRDAVMAEVEDTSRASGGARLSSSAKIATFCSTISGPFSCTNSTSPTASPRLAAIESRAAAPSGSSASP